MDRETIICNLNELCNVKFTHDGFRVTTHCMYPSNGLIRVTVRAGTNSVVVSDEGETVGEATAAGIIIKDSDKLLRAQIKNRGLLIQDGVIYSPRIEIDAAHIAIMHVANVAKDTAHWLYEHGGVKRKQDFRTLLSEFLNSSFRENVSEGLIRGVSNKSHKFSNVISFANGRKFIVDAVSNDPNSINSRVVANLDIKSSNNPNILQRIIYNDEEPWSASNLSLLQIGATPVPFSRAREVISRIADEVRLAA